MPKQAKYKLVVDTSGLQYKTEGKTLLEALNALPLKWNEVKAKAEFTVSQGKLTYTHLFYMKVFRRILINKVTRLMWAKRLELLLQAQK